MKLSKFPDHSGGAWGSFFLGRSGCSTKLSQSCSPVHPANGYLAASVPLIGWSGCGPGWVCCGVLIYIPKSYTWMVCWWSQTACKTLIHVSLLGWNFTLTIATSEINENICIPGLRGSWIFTEEYWCFPHLNLPKTSRNVKRCKKNRPSISKAAETYIYIYIQHI